MLHRIKMDEESSSDASSRLSTDTSTTTISSTTNDFEKMDLNSDPSLSSVLSSSATQDSRSSSRPPSRPGTPSRNSSFASTLFHRRQPSGSGSERESKKKKDREDHMCRWLQAGNVIYKSVGLGLMDLTVGMKMIEFARIKGVGTHVEGF